MRRYPNQTKRRGINAAKAKTSWPMRDCSTKMEGSLSRAFMVMVVRPIEHSVFVRLDVLHKAVECCLSKGNDEAQRALAVDHNPFSLAAR